jgi:hypothetical protein
MTREKAAQIHLGEVFAEGAYRHRRRGQKVILLKIKVGAILT